MARLTLGVPMNLRPLISVRANHAEMADTTYVGGDGNPLAADPDDGLLVTDRWTTPIVIVFGRATPSTEGEFAELASYADLPGGTPGPGPTDWFADWDLDVGMTAEAVGGSNQFLEVRRPTWNIDPLSLVNPLQWPIRADFDQTMEAAGFVILHVVASTEGFNGTADDLSHDRGLHASVNDVRVAHGVAGASIAGFDPHDDVPPRGMVVQLLHQSALLEDEFFVAFDSVANLDNDDGSGFVAVEQGGGYGRGGAAAGHNYRHMWRVRIAYDHASTPVDPLLPDNTGGLASYDWMATSFMVRPPSLGVSRLRQKQRDDALRSAPSNHPTSVQSGRRAGKRNTYS